MWGKPAVSSRIYDNYLFTRDSNIQLLLLIMKSQIYTSGGIHEEKECYVMSSLDIFAGSNIA